MIAACQCIGVQDIHSHHLEWSASPGGDSGGFLRRGAGGKLNELEGFTSFLAGHTQNSYGKTLLRGSVPLLSMPHSFSISIRYLLAAARNAQTAQVPEEVIFTWCKLSLLCLGWSSVWRKSAHKLRTAYWSWA